MKKCTICKVLKDESEYNKNKCKKDGLNTLCRLCSQKRSRQYYSENREHHIQVTGKRKNAVINHNRRYIYDYLMKHPCVDCGETDPIVLEFDHIRGIKRKTICEIIGCGCSHKSLLEEIEKCEVRCANCHRRKTAIEGNWYAYKFSKLKSNSP